MAKGTSTKYIWQHAGLYIMNYSIALARRRWCIERACEDTEVNTSQTSEGKHELDVRKLIQMSALNLTRT